VGVIIDSSVLIAAERRRETPASLVAQVIAKAGDQEAALSSVGLTELIHGIYRSQTKEVRTYRELFLSELLIGLIVYPYTSATAMIDGKSTGNSKSGEPRFHSAIC
jgi:predicted nucleic acid-binding protein